MSEDKTSKRRTPPITPANLARALRRDRDEAPQEVEAAEPAPPPGPVIRRATARDLASVVALRALMFTALGAGAEAVADNAWQAAAHRWLQVHLGNPRVYICVADLNGSAVACSIGEVVDRPPSPANPSGRVGMLGNVATFPEYRMTGLGQACVDAVMAWFRDETDVSSVELFATPEGRRRYAAHGFTEHEFPQLRVTLDRTPPDQTSASSI